MTYSCHIRYVTILLSEKEIPCRYTIMPQNRRERGKEVRKMDFERVELKEKKGGWAAGPDKQRITGYGKSDRRPVGRLLRKGYLFCH